MSAVLDQSGEQDCLAYVASNDEVSDSVVTRSASFEPGLIIRSLLRALRRKARGAGVLIPACRRRGQMLVPLSSSPSTGIKIHHGPT